MHISPTAFAGILLLGASLARNITPRGPHLPAKCYAACLLFSFCQWGSKTMAWQVVETQEVARLYPIHTKWVCLSLLFLPAHAWVWNGAFQDLYIRLLTGRALAK